MTRNHELDCQDIFECAHEPETPVVNDYGRVVHWLCRCGRVIGTKRKKAVPVEGTDNSVILVDEEDK